MPDAAPISPGDVAKAADGLASELRAARDELLSCVEELPESRSYRATEREGWTLKHELAYLAAADRVLLDLIESLRAAPGSTHGRPLVLATTETDRRRLYGEAMHVTQELRLDPLRQELAALGDALPRAVEEHAALLSHPVVLGDAPATALDHLRAHLERCRGGVERLSGALG